MLFLAVSQNTGDPTPYLEAEQAKVAELQEAGLIEQIYLKGDQSGAVLLVRAADLATARTGIESLPIALHGLTRVELTELLELDGLPSDK